MRLRPTNMNENRLEPTLYCESGVGWAGRLRSGEEAVEEFDLECALEPILVAPPSRPLGGKGGGTGRCVIDFSSVLPLPRDRTAT
jgi:hypothetical protein